MDVDRMSRRILLALLCALCAFSLVFMIYIILRKQERPAETVYTPPPFDYGARSGFPNVPESLGFSSLAIEQGYNIYLCGNLTVTEEAVPIYFTSPKDNTVWLRLQMTDGAGNLLAETGIIKPGEYIEQIKISNVLKQETPITLKMIAYQPDTYISMGNAVLNTTLKPKK